MPHSLPLLSASPRLVGGVVAFRFAPPHCHDVMNSGTSDGDRNVMCAFFFVIGFVTAICSIAAINYVTPMVPHAMMFYNACPRLKDGSSSCHWEAQKPKTTAPTGLIGP